MVTRARGSLVVLAMLVGCNVSTADNSTGGLPDAGVVQAEAGSGEGSLEVEGADAQVDATALRVCPRALLVAGSDYSSTNISLLSSTGTVLSSSIISSASTPAGLTTALSGDVVFPSATPASGSLVLIDRYPNSVLTWVDPSTAMVQRQMSVGTGFAANPQDYLELSASKAYVSRYNTNAAAGQQANDGGGDVLIVNLASGEVSGRIDMAQADDGDILPRPSTLLRVKSRVWTVLQRNSADFLKSSHARIVGIDPITDTIAWSLDLPGAQGCGGIAQSPSGAVVALACSSLLGDPASAAQGTVVFLDATTDPPSELKRVSTTSLGMPLSSSLAFVSDTQLLGVAFGSNTGAPDAVYTLDTTTGATTVVAQGSAAFTLGDARCFPGCTDQCWITDAGSKTVRAWNITPDGLVAAPPITVETTIGLPPRSLGAL